jgi:hypothetical protein
VSDGGNPLPDDSARQIFAGRTGTGGELDVHDEGDWLTFRYIDGDGETAGFALNPLYADALALVLLNRAMSRAQFARL